MANEAQIEITKEIAGNAAPTRIKRSPKTYGMRLSGAEWQVLRGNKIIGRYTTEAEAEERLRQKLGLTKPPRVQKPRVTGIRVAGICKEHSQPRSSHDCRN